jgi:hypothetical protein
MSARFPNSYNLLSVVRLVARFTSALSVPVLLVLGAMSSGCSVETEPPAPGAESDVLESMSELTSDSADVQVTGQLPPGAEVADESGEDQFGSDVAGPAEVDVEGAPSAADGFGSRYAECVPHYANTATWMDCRGGAERSWVRLRSKCGQIVCLWYWSKWYRVDPGARRTVSRHCVYRACGASWGVRPY